MVHISQSTCDELSRTGGYTTTLRNDLQVKVIKSYMIVQLYFVKYVKLFFFF